MAVVQISQIQVRRGKKSQTNMPQLSGGEFGWAVDTQQLYIGNGSVAEGAPFVGNTEILTQNSNIFALLGTYTYKGHTTATPSTGIDVNNPIRRTLQEKLDDVVNARDFGVKDISDSIQTITERTAALQRALDQLYLNASDKGTAPSKRILYVPAGEYTINEVLRIPSYATIIGEGHGKTIITQTLEDKSVFQTVSTASTPGNYITLSSMTGVTYPRNVQIAGITFKRDDAAVIATPMALIDCLQDSKIQFCEFIGSWSNGQGSDTDGSNSAIQIRSLGGTPSKSVFFDNCIFVKTVHAVYADYYATDFKFTNCVFNSLYRGLTIAKGADALVPGKEVASADFIVEGSRFDSIDAEAWKVFNTVGGGTGHVSRNNSFYDVGNYNQGYSNPVFPVLDFRTANCKSVTDHFERSIQINGTGPVTIAYLPDVLGPQTISYPARNAVLAHSTPLLTPKTLFKLPLWSGIKVTVDYVIKKQSSYRTGTLTITAHPDMNVVGSSVIPGITDQFTFSTSGAFNTSITSTAGGNINFSAVTASLIARPESDPINGSPITKPTLLIKYANPDGPGSDANIEYSITITTGYTQL